ncbi:hypothetical protein BIW11_08431 [Tropilaelaps mercedesae]|uniref:Uncharacterized protein n=1 Tax=Tropilaelaps mercedesae TaxID=418985 RepID=A0A1V9XPI8_9ACAR|nr:hypothetical protein BIW11_08431 [Tropilaelaps mercedesae]
MSALPWLRIGHTQPLWSPYPNISPFCAILLDDSGTIPATEGGRKINKNQAQQANEENYIVS